MAKSGHYKESPASVTLSKNKELLKERLNAIMNFKKKSKAIVGITIILTIFFSAGAITAGAYSLPKEADEKIIPHVRRALSTVLRHSVHMDCSIMRNLTEFSLTGKVKPL